MEIKKTTVEHQKKTLDAIIEGRVHILPEDGVTPEQVIEQARRERARLEERPT